MPVQALLQALAQASNVGSVGRISRLPLRTCSMSFSEVASITYSGVRNQAANSSSTVHSSTRCSVRRAHFLTLSSE